MTTHGNHRYRADRYPDSKYTIDRISTLKHSQFRFSAISLAALLLAATAANAERTYKWVDAEGNTHYGDHVPLQATAQRRQEINGQGRTLKSFDGPDAAEQIAAQKRLASIEHEEQKLSAEQASLDSQLLASYASEEDLLLARDNEVEAIKEFIRMTEIRIDSLQKRLTDLSGEIADYERRGKPVPGFVQQQSTNISAQIEQNQAIILNKQAELELINKSYAADIERYQALQNRNLSAR